MEIRKAKFPDSVMLAETDRIAGKEMKFWAVQSEKDFKKSIKVKNYLAIVAFSDGRMVGYLDSEYDSWKKIVWLKNIFVLKKFRRNKVAKMMLKALEKYWKSKVDLCVLLTSDRNLKIFEKLGFKKTMNYMMRKI